MSLAKVHTFNKVRKEWVCGKCRKTIQKGESRLSYAVGFRGVEQTRCTDPKCYPQPSERESSLVATVYSVIEGVDFSTATCLEDLSTMIQDVVDACEEVASEYEDNEMFEMNYDLQERADRLHDAASELESWADSLDDEPEEGTEEHDEFMEEARDTAQEAVNNLDI